MHNINVILLVGGQNTRLKSIDQKKGNQPKALIKINSNHAGAYNNLGRIYTEVGEFDKALSICEKLLKNNPDDMIVLYHKLRILKKLYKFQESNLICKKLLDVYPDNGDILYDMSANFLKMNDIEKFLSTLQKAINAIPNLKNKSKNNKEFVQFHNDNRFLKIVLE